MLETIQEFLSQPWYLIVLAVVVFIYANFKDGVKSFKEGMDSVNKNDVSYRYAKKTTLTDDEQFAIALDAIMTAYWEVDNNLLTFTHKGKKPHHFDDYMNGWFINTKEGYEDLRKYFIHEGRRSYFDFIYPLYKKVPSTEWSAKMEAMYGNADRPRKILSRLSEHKVIDTLIKQGVITNESEMDIGVLGWDVSVLIGQARRAYTAGLVSEQEALSTIKTAANMARKNFDSWKEFGQSQMIGMALDYYHHDDTFFNDYIETYHQVTTDTQSPWNTIPWKK